MKVKKGFSKTVLLVAFVIIAVSGFYIYNNLSRRSNTDESKIKADLVKVRLYAMSCLSGGGKVNPPVAGSTICTTKLGTNKNQVWPTLPLSWSYSSDSNITSKNSLKIKVISGNDQISCDIKECK
ncbi:MAG: hypothetical protein M1324_00565 [Patescibacteria group bacterium]|nr:hypothetical protein [Patescibacteria group bacterium]